MGDLIKHMYLIKCSFDVIRNVNIIIILQVGWCSWSYLEFTVTSSFFYSIWNSLQLFSLFYLFNWKLVHQFFLQGKRITPKKFDQACKYQWWSSSSEKLEKSWTLLRIDPTLKRGSTLLFSKVEDFSTFSEDELHHWHLFEILQKPIEELYLEKRFCKYVLQDINVFTNVIGFTFLWDQSDH